LSKNTPQDVATFLSAAGIGLTLGTNLFLGSPKDSRGNIPNNSVFILGGSGARPERTMGEVSEIRRPITHVRLRYNKFQTGDTMARSIQDTLRAASISGYLDVVALQSEPQNLGSDMEGRYLWNIGYQLSFEDSA